MHQIGFNDVQYVTAEQKVVKEEDMNLLTDPDNGVVMVPNLNVNNLEVIPEPEPERVQSSTEDVPHDF
eukprot:4281387-Amphidinium_carterae.1